MKTPLIRVKNIGGGALDGKTGWAQAVSPDDIVIILVMRVLAPLLYDLTSHDYGAGGPILPGQWLVVFDDGTATVTTDPAISTEEWELY